MAIGVKKWFMLQMWRVQQIAAILSLLMLAVTDALLIYNLVSWRSGVFETPYTGATLILVIIGLAIWIASILWDTKLRMWREQMTVLVERNPYSKEKMSPKEIVHYRLVWLPLLKKLGKDDPSLKEYGETMEAWMEHVIRDDPSVAKEVEDLMSYVKGAPLKHDRDRDGSA